MRYFLLTLRWDYIGENNRALSKRSRFAGCSVSWWRHQMERVSALLTKMFVEESTQKMLVKIFCSSWLNGVVVACQRCHASGRGSVPGSASRIIPASNCTMRGQNNWGNWGSPCVMKLLSGMGGASMTREVPGVSKRRFLSEVGYATLPRFPQCKHSPKWSKFKKRHSSATLKK